MNLIQVFRERELLAQCTNLDLLEEWLAGKPLTFYIGFDPTASSLHIGHFMQMRTIKYFQDAGHRAIVLLGGGTAMVGDPSGKTDMRPMLTNEEVDSYIANFKVQMSRYIDVSEEKALFVNNADWLCGIKYIDMLREVGGHFSVNRMLAAECFKSRLEKGLSFLEFNYMIMQGYDFYRLYKDHGCTLQCGGDDQWSNIIAGVDLVRRKEAREENNGSKGEADKAIGVTFALLPGADGTKMGKTAGNAVWLDPELTSPYDFYQVWRNTDDSLVVQYLKMMTDVPLAEIDEMAAGFSDATNINAAKGRLAYELTAMIHGDGEAAKAQTAAKSLFYGSMGMDSANMPTTTLTDDSFSDNHDMLVVDLLVIGGLAKSKREARQLIEQGGVLVDDVKVTDIADVLTREQVSSGVIIKKGKKAFMKFVM